MDPLAPPPTVLVKLGSVLVHADELLSAGGHAFDRAALEGLVRDPELVEWRAAADRLALLPVMRRDSFAVDV